MRWFSKLALYVNVIMITNVSTNRKLDKVWRQCGITEKECKQWCEPKNVMWRDVHFINDTTAATDIS